MSQDKFDELAGAMRGYEYPLNVPPRPDNPRTLDIDDMERVRRYKELYGGCVSDALMRCGVVDTVLTHDLKPLRAHSILAGRALPVKWHSLAPETHMTEAEKKARQEQWEREGSPQKKLHMSAFPGCVYVFDTGHDTQAATFGEMSCHLAQSLGCVGVVNEGMTRDVRKILEVEDFPYFSLGTTPNAYGGWRVMEVDVPIYLRGHLRHYVIINPGDFIFGDDDGLQVIPKDLVDEVLLTAEDILGTEIWQRKLIDTGEIDIHEVYERFGDL
jgi:regulator of RNase E activity RraA